MPGKSLVCLREEGHAKRAVADNKEKLVEENGTNNIYN
jgi:hypothetical protein